MTLTIHSNQNDKALAIQQGFGDKQIQILKNSICKGLTNEEFEVFLMACAKTNLDPFMRQIYAVKRNGKLSDGKYGQVMTIQTGIDGYRLIAERTGRYAPGTEPTYVYDEKGALLSATSYIKKLTPDGTWHVISASAYIDEYMQSFTDKNTGERRPTGLWVTMPRTMLAKCAEAQALRKAFPAEMSGVYTKEEMLQADPQKISVEQESELENIIGDCDTKYQQWVKDYMKEKYDTVSYSDLPLDAYAKLKKSALQNMEATRAKQTAASIYIKDPVDSPSVFEEAQ